MSAAIVEARSEHRFHVRARHDAHVSPHRIIEASFEAAAIAFIERWHPTVEANGVMSVIVADEHGCERCFTVDLEHGDASPCA